MIVLDHNIPRDEAEKLRRGRMHFRQVGFEVGRPEWDDQQEILRFLHATKQITFFTRDLGFFRAPLRHPNYCLVALTVPVLDTAYYISKLLRHPHFNTRAKRNGKVVKVSTRNNLLGDRAAATEHRPLVTLRHRVPLKIGKFKILWSLHLLSLTEQPYQLWLKRSAESSGRSAWLPSD